MIEAGRKLQERYRIDRQIGQGGMGAVYVATDERFGSVVAIKETLCMDDNYRKAIEREARLLNSLKHNALPRVTDHFLEENGQFLVMEFIPGEDLSITLEGRNEPFSVSEVLDWADQLLEALVFLHTQENPVIHRDIKPQNLKVTPKGQIILLDFGLAKGNVTGAGNQTNAKSIFGYSRNYASLEQIQGTGTDPRSDLYSLAATLYHLLTFVPPEDALTRAMSVLSQKADPLVPVNQLRPDIPAGVAVILQKAMDLDAAERPASAAEMRRMLRDHEAYANTVLGTYSIARGESVDIHSQKTRLMPGVTSNEAGASTKARTEVLPRENPSQETALRQFAGNRTTDGEARPPSGSPNRSRRALAFASVAGLLLLGTGIFAGVYFYNSADAVGLDVVPPVTTDQPPQPQTQIQSTEPPPPGSILSESGAAAAGDQPSNSAVESQTGAKAPETAASDKKSAAKSKNADSNSDGRSVVGGENIYVGNIRVENGRVIMPDGRVYKTGETPDVPVIEPEVLRELQNIDPSQLTPAQRRKLRILRQRYPRPMPPPRPSSSPGQ